MPQLGSPAFRHGPTGCWVALRTQEESLGRPDRLEGSPAHVKAWGFAFSTRRQRQRESLLARKARALEEFKQQLAQPQLQSHPDAEVGAEVVEVEELEEVAGVGAGRGATPPATPPATSKQKRRREAEAERGGFGGGGGGGGGGFTAMLRELGAPGERSAEETLAFIEAQVGARLQTLALILTLTPTLTQP